MLYVIMVLCGGVSSGEGWGNKVGALSWWCVLVWGGHEGAEGIGVARDSRLVVGFLDSVDVVRGVGVGMCDKGWLWAGLGGVSVGRGGSGKSGYRWVRWVVIGSSRFASGGWVMLLDGSCVRSSCRVSTIQLGRK